MTRKAIIIASPLTAKKESYLAGVEVDKANYKRFLCSPLGGFWYDTEITILTNPSSSAVTNAMSSISSTDYALIVFCGHGNVQNGSTFIKINDSEMINSNLLRVGASKQTLILDCCREVQPIALMDSLEARASIVTKAELNSQECRKYYDKAISDSKSGLIVLHGCALNEYCGEDASKGGYYSSSLVKAARDWHGDSQDNTASTYGIFTVPTAHDNAAILVKGLSGKRQNPDIEQPRTLSTLPFAVIA